MFEELLNDSVRRLCVTLSDQDLGLSACVFLWLHCFAAVLGGAAEQTLNVGSYFSPQEVLAGPTGSCSCSVFCRSTTACS